MPTRSRFYYKREKIVSRPVSSDRISRVQDRFKEDAPKTTITKDSKSDLGLLKGKRTEDSSNPQAGLTDRKDSINGERNVPSQIILPRSSPRQEPRITQLRMERSSTTINRKLRSARLVDKRAAKLEWKNPDSKGPGSSAIHRRV